MHLPEDPVREAVDRYIDRFPEVREAVHTDPVTAALFKHIRRCLVQADVAMQDEGLPAVQRRRVITAALYGSVDEDAAVARRAEHDTKHRELSGLITRWPAGPVDPDASAATSKEN